MEFGCNVIQSDVRTTVEWARGIEDKGYEWFGVMDSQSLTRELYVTLSAVAHHTERIQLGPYTTNPVTRHPGVTASALSTLNELSNDRVLASMSSGDSAVRTLGLEPASLRDKREAYRTIKALIDGETTTYDGAEVTLQWVDGDEERARDIPVYMVADGPKSLELAGRIADGVVSGLGLNREVVTGIVETIEKGARKAGRSIDEIPIWLSASVNQREDTEAAIEEMLAGLATKAHYSLQVSMDEKWVPDEYEEPILDLVDHYDPQEHVNRGVGSPNAALVDEHGLRAYLSDRYLIAGDAAACREKIQQIDAVDEISGLMMSFSADANGEDAIEFADSVLSTL